MKVIEGQRDALENEIIDTMLDSFKADSAIDHEQLMAQIDRLKPKGKLQAVTSQTSSARCEQ